jgi:ElaB/YqjD/DUF883 family membrane-anchored ribosome-binding protein
MQEQRETAIHVGDGSSGTGGTGPMPGADGPRRGGLAAASTELRNLAADLEDVLQGVSGMSDADVARIKARVERAVEDARATIAGRTERIRLQAADATAATEQYVRRQPWTAIGLAAAAGLVLGLVAGRPGRRDSDWD